MPAWDKELLEAVALSLVEVERQLALKIGLSYSAGDLIEAKDHTNPLAHASLDISMATCFVSTVLNEGEYSMPFAYLSGLLLAEAEGLDDEFLAEGEGWMMSFQRIPIEGHCDDEGRMGTGAALAQSRGAPAEG